ncbi:MFS transporter, putative [Talaromyces stipitatus ATCC 10500]|uniref:MFS transporter, putative n=1 Tax=Talaromyces stipitatus (strain ATCC 10500 / CBS 375.48 / QM 6759 / NRRL 1006) TaxID=441959 RepID=B8M686_TALSN|nr:MFS transporter, putative [Talaromyces stipitatus ATCC 10500]EED19261.1 MFS transporter, putative [Talaromyces stipitatus ATCC 10500]
MVSSESQAITRRPSTQHYQTFSTPPPKSRGRPPSHDSDRSHSFGSPQSNGDDDQSTTGQNKLPKKQMAVLAMIALAEQTALNSISPYLPDMTSRFPEVHGENVGVYVGLIASAFALAQFITNYYWGWLSDRVGRKPVILLGTACTAVCFVLFGFCTTLWQAILVQALMGILNGNAGLVSTCLGEITNRSNQSRAFTYLPVLYGIGGITGPLLGGSLVLKTNPLKKGEPNPYPYVLPNVISASILIIDFILVICLLEESLEDAENLPTITDRFKQLFSWVWEFTTSHRPTYLRVRSGPVYHHLGTRHGRSFSDLTHDETDLDSASETAEEDDHPPELTREEIFNRDTILLLLTYLIFALVNVSFNSLYPIFAQAPEPAGRELSPQEIGLSLGFSGVVTIIFQICVFGKLRDKMGNKWSYRAGLLGFVIAFLLMPLIGYKGSDKNGRLSKNSALLAVELCFVLLVKTVAAVGGLTSALLLVTNSAPNHSVLGALNGLAQTLSAAGRAVGPFLSGGLFSLAQKLQKSEMLAFGVFAAVAFVGFVLSFGIRSSALEAAGWSSDEDDLDKSDDEIEHGA